MQQPPNLDEEAFGLVCGVANGLDRISHVPFLQHPLMARSDPDSDLQRLCLLAAPGRAWSSAGLCTSKRLVEHNGSISAQMGSLDQDSRESVMASLNSSDTKWHHCRVDRLCGFTIYHIRTLVSQCQSV